MKKYIVDRIEEDIVVLQNDENENEIINVNKTKLDFDVKEGDVIVLNESGEYVYDENETRIRDVFIEELIDDLWE